MCTNLRKINYIISVLKDFFSLKVVFLGLQFNGTQIICYNYYEKNVRVVL